MRQLYNFALLALLMFSTGAQAGMFGFLKKYDVQLFPEVQGQVLKEGRPMEGLKVTREAVYDASEIQTTETDSDGRFHFPEWIIRSGTPGKAFDETRLGQVVITEHEGQTYLLWHNVTPRTDGEKVTSGLLRNLECDLKDEEQLHHFPTAEKPEFTHNIHSICRWPE